MSQMDTEQFNIPASMVRQFCFCRRIPFFQLVRNITGRPPAHVKLGVDFHKKIEQLMKRRDLSSLCDNESYDLVLEKSLYSYALGTHGICDACLIAGDLVVPLEVKMHPKPVASRGDKFQLCVYALMLEELYQTRIDFGFILFEKTSKSIKVDFDEKLRTDVKACLTIMEKDSESGLVPPTAAGASSCAQCEFLNFCADRY